MSWWAWLIIIVVLWALLALTAAGVWAALSIRKDRLQTKQAMDDAKAKRGSDLH